MQAEDGSGIRFMSDSWMAFQPAIEEPSNMMPSAKVSSSTVLMSTVTCCHLPRGSVKRKSAYFTSLSLINFRTSLAVVIVRLPLFWSCPTEVWVSDRVEPRFPRPDPDRFFYVGDENLPVPYSPCLRSPAYRVNGLLDHVVAEHDFDFHLREKIHHVFGAAIELGVPLLPPKALGLSNRNTLKANLLERLLHLIELERLDDGLDFFHVLDPRIARGNVGCDAAKRVAGPVPSAEIEEMLMFSTP